MAQYGHQLKPQQPKRLAIAQHRQQIAEHKRQVGLIRVIATQQPKLVILLLKRWLSETNSQATNR